jgi:hypothetical protein
MHHRLRRRYGLARQAGWLTATARTPANDRAANKAYLKAKKEKVALELAWSRAMTSGQHEYAAKLSKQADEQGAIITAAQHYAQLPKEARE